MSKSIRFVSADKKKSNEHEQSNGCIQWHTMCMFISKKCILHVLLTNHFETSNVLVVSSHFFTLVNIKFQWRYSPIKLKKCS